MWFACLLTVSGGSIFADRDEPPPRRQSYCSRCPPECSTDEMKREKRGLWDTAVHVWDQSVYNVATFIFHKYLCSPIGQTSVILRHCALHLHPNCPSLSPLFLSVLPLVSGCPPSFPPPFPASHHCMGVIFCAVFQNSQSIRW